MAVLSGCGVGEQDKTIVLPPLENQVMDSEKFRFDHIQQYIGSGYAENVICLAWGNPGKDMLCLLKKEDGRYVYHVIDTREDTVLSSIFVDDRSLANVSIAPGGGYLSYEVQDGEESGDVYLVEDIRSQPVKTKLISGNEGTYDPFIYVCANGDHMFLMEWVNYSMYQISGVRIVDGKVDGHPVVLYNDNYESLNQIKIVNDQALVFWGEEFLENNGYRYKVTVLRY